MTVNECDNCHEVINKGEMVLIGRSIFRDKIELCQECAAPIIASVKRSNIGCSLKAKINMQSAKHTNPELEAEVV